MDTQSAAQAAILIRAGVDLVRSLVARRAPTPKGDLIPVYRLVTQDQVLRARADRAVDITGAFAPR
jgi:hypothetical protein